MKAPPIYVELRIATPLERVWELTQSPELHERWDLRFSSITYLPRAGTEPQRFTYRTRIGFGLAIEGGGESVGETERTDGTRSSVLRFWSDDPKSLIREGAGFWRYVPVESAAVTFLTRYDYAVRFGPAGALVDRLFLRPMMGWATAWSFDRLRLWAERDIAPEISLRCGATYALARAAVAFTWIYQGLVPKLLGPHADELALLRAAGLNDPAAFALGFGAAEVLFGLVVLGAWRARWPLWVSIAAMGVALAQVMATAPAYLPAAFNPVTLNLLLAAAAGCALLTRTVTPFASAAKRRPTRP